MASSKKYGYKLRGEKLSLLELDITGTGNGLNYTYEENAGLDISTDPSSWKSPLATITDGLQIEYLSNAFNLQNTDTETFFEIIPVEDSNMDNIDWLTSLDQNFLSFLAPSAELKYPTTLSKVEATGANGTTTNILKVVTTSILEGGSAYNTQGFEIGFHDLTIGKEYKFSMDLKLNCQQISPFMEYHLWMEKFSEAFNFSSQGEPFVFENEVNITPPDSSNKMKIRHPEAAANPIGSLNTGWTNCSFTFIADNNTINFVITPPSMSGTVDDDYYLYIDNILISELLTPTNDISESEITLPSYAQKALLDYVRAQEAYEGGDLEKWDFFMKQFRSKLERWEDSRITGPRVLGPHGPSSIT